MNRIYFFTGTGNSLCAAKSIAEKLGDCEIIAIHKGVDMTVPAGMERVGFVFPVYGWGLPLMVKSFLRGLTFSDKPYLFAVATMGGLSLNALPQARDILGERGITLDYAASLAMVRNSVTNYNMTDKPDPVLAKAKRRLETITADIAGKAQKPCGKVNKLIERLHVGFVNQLAARSAEYAVSDECIGCGICVKVCPADNITLTDKKPAFGMACEGCVACIQFCPKRAINYGKTAERRRYTHPQVSYGALAAFYKKGE